MDPREPLLIGRTDEVATLTAHLRAAVSGSGRVVVMEGEPGVGKSRLVRVIAELSVENGLSVHIGRAHHQEVERTLGATLDAFGMRLDDLAGKAAATRMVLESDAPAAARFLLIDRLLQVLDERCELTPVLLVIEDLHWADPATLAWVRAAGEHVATLPLLLVLTTRPMRAPTQLRQLLDELPGDRLMLAALSRSDATALARRVYGHEPDGTLQDAVDRASGNPMLVIAAAEAAAAGSAPGPRSISARLAELDQRALAALQTAAVLGESVHPVELAAVIGGRIADLVVDLHHCAAAGFLVQHDDRMVFRHDLHQRAVLESMTPAARQLLHLDAARSLARSGAPAVDVAEHYARGALPGDRQAVAWLQEAASDIVVTAPAGALRLVDIARGLCESSPPVGLLLVQVRALASSGRIADAETLGLSLLRDGLDPSVESGLRRELAFTALMRGDRLQSVTQIERCAALITDPSAATRVRGEIAIARLLAVDHGGARQTAEQAIEEGTRHGELAGRIAGEAVLCLLDLYGHRTSAAVFRADRILQLSELPGAEHAHLFQPWFVASLVWVETDNLERLAVTAQHGRRVAQVAGTAWALPVYDGVAAFGAMRAGLFDDAAAIAEATLASIGGADGLGITVWCHAFLAQVYLHHANVEAAESHLYAAELTFSRDVAQLGFEWIQSVRAQIQEQRGAPDAALASLSQAWDLLAGAGVCIPLPMVGPAIVRLACGAGDSHRARGATSTLTQAAADSGTVSTYAAAELAGAWCDRDPDRALSAAHIASSTPRKALTAVALTDAAALLRMRGRKAEADSVGHRAAGNWAALGADRDAAACAALTGSRRAPKARPTFGVAALTGTEREVVARVAGGHTNTSIASQLGVSRRTVETHMSSAYRKLGVTSRVEVATIALRHGISAGRGPSR